jgi:hypothetical protein
VPGFVLLVPLCLLEGLRRGCLSTPCSACVSRQSCFHRAAAAAILQCNCQQQSPLPLQQRHRAAASARRASHHRGCLNPITTRRPRAAHRPMRQSQGNALKVRLGKPWAVRRSVPSSKRGRPSLTGTHHSAPELKELQVGGNAITRLQTLLYCTHLQHRVPRSGRAARYGI